MLNKKITYQIHIILAGVVSVFAIYFLGKTNILGWVFQSMAGFLYASYFLRKDLLITATVILGAEALLPLYGVYKWSVGIGSFTFVDILILSTTLVFVLYVAYKMFSKRAGRTRVTVIEFLNALLYIAATLFLSITQSVYAWVLFALSFFIVLILFVIKKDWLAAFFQALYVILALIPLVLFLEIF